MKNNLEEVFKINPMNNKKYIEAVSFRDWQTCDLICDEHSVLVGRIKHLQKDLDLALNALQRESEENEELELELQKTREHLGKAIKSAEFFMSHADCQRNSWVCKCSFCRDTESSKNLREARQYFQDKDKQGE